jgi:dynein heavy chain
LYEINVHLQELPEQWNNTKKIALTVKQQVAPLQANEVANIRKRSATFDVVQHKFREEFRKIPPFWYICKDPYEHLDVVCINYYYNIFYLPLYN